MSAEEALRGPLPTRLRQRLLTRSVILEAATGEIEERGFDEARMGEIARRAGVTRPTLYAHFPTKTDFLREVCTRAQASILVDLRSRLSADADGPFLHRLVDAVFDLSAAASPVLRREGLGLLCREPRREWLSEPLVGFVVEHVERARAAGEIPGALPAEALARMLVTALFGFLALDDENDVERRRQAHTLVGSVVAGLATETKPRAPRSKRGRKPVKRRAKRAPRKT